MKLHISIKQLIQIYLLLLCTNVFSQKQSEDNQYIPKISYIPYIGKFVARTSTTKALDNTPYIAQEFQIGIQTTGKKYWHSALNYPSYGIGIYNGMFLENYKGAFWGSFLYIDLPIFTAPKQSIDITLALGSVINCNNYNITDDPDFLQHSSYANVYSKIVFSYKYAISDHLNVGGGVRFQHFSNGGWQYPNPGMEMLSAQISVNYIPKKHTIKKSQQKEPPKRTDQWTICYVVGQSGSPTDYSTKYLNTTASIAFSAIRKPCYDFGIGVDYTYNGHLVENFPNMNNIPISYLTSNGIFISNELITGKCRLGLQIGSRIISKAEYSSPIYERLTLRYQFAKKTFVHFGIKLNLGRSEFLEWGVGYKI